MTGFMHTMVLPLAHRSAFLKLIENKVQLTSPITDNIWEYMTGADDCSHVRTYIESIQIIRDGAAYIQRHYLSGSVSGCIQLPLIIGTVHARIIVSHSVT